MNLPNVLTLSRIVFAFFIVLLLLTNCLAGYIAAAVFFTAASLTDFYDGYLAKKHGAISNFGKIMDPIADKVLILAIFGALAHLGIVAWWMVICIAVREVAVTASRLAAMAAGEVQAAEVAGKIKTVCQIVTISVILLFVIVEQSAFSAGWFHRVETGWRALIQALMFATLILTLASGALYFKNKWKK